MFRIKQRRTKPIYLSNNITIFPTMNATGKYSKYINKNNYFEINCKNKGCVKIGCLCKKNLTQNSNLTKESNIFCCKGSPYRNPLLGYRKERKCCSGKNKIKNDIYKDTYAKTCGNPKNNTSCYNNVITSKQNKNGYVNESYNYNTNQYLSRQCGLYQQQEFNFVSKNSIPNQKNTFISCNNCQISNIGKCIKNKKTFCLDINDLPCNFKNYKCTAVYKRNNPKYNQQGAVSGGSRINRLKYQTKIKSQGTIINGQKNLVNGQYPGSLYMVSKPSTMRNTMCMLNKDRNCNNLLQRCKINNTIC